MTNSDLKRIIGENIKTCRKKRGLTQEALAEAVGISTPFCAQIESGKRTVSIYILYRLAMVLNTSIDALVSAERRNFLRNDLLKSLENRSDEYVGFILNFIELLDDSDLL